MTGYPPFERWLLFGHILSAIVWFGGGVMLSILASRARSSSDPNAVADFARTLVFAGPRVLGPANIGTVVFGVWLVAKSGAWDFSQTWVRIGAGLFAIAFLIGAAYLGRIGVQLQRAAEGSEAVAAEPRVLLGRWILGYRVILLILLVAVWDMVFKPGF
jgi:uncharacterized membrane protein